MADKDYYRILGVPRTADDKAIKAAFRDLARKFHPDVNDAPDASERFKEINEAYSVLSDEEKRAQYDRYGASFEQYGQSGGYYDWASNFGTGGSGGRARRSRVNVEYNNLNDLFNDFFQSAAGRAAGPGSQASFRGEDITHEVEITLAEAWGGALRQLRRGDGDTVTARIPPGARTGTKVRLAGRGAPGLNGENGDLYLVIKVADDATFTREGDDLHTEVAMSLYTAMLGGSVRVPTIDGRGVTLRIKPETQNGQLIRLRGKGMPLLRTPEQFGDLIVKVRVAMPTDLTDEERELFRKLAVLRGEGTATAGGPNDVTGVNEP